MRGISKKTGEKPSPVVTLVLYFGYKGRWTAPKSIHEALDVPEILKPYVSDMRMNLYEIAYLSWDQVNMFQSDFREVARYFVQIRENGEYQPSDDEMKHLTQVLQLLNVMDKDKRYETAVNEKVTKEAKTMSEWLTRVLNKSKEEGQEKGEDVLSEALVDLRKQGREADAWKAMEDKQYRAQILEEFRAKRAETTA